MANETPVDAPPAPRPERPRNRIQVSREKRPLNFFIGLAKKFLVSEDEVELSGLGLAVTTVVTVAEILKNSGHVTITKITTSLVDMQTDSRGNMPKAKIQIWIKKSPDFAKLVAESETKKATNSDKVNSNSNDAGATSEKKGEPAAADTAAPAASTTAAQE